MIKLTGIVIALMALCTARHVGGELRLHPLSSVLRGEGRGERRLQSEISNLKSQIQNGKSPSPPPSPPSTGERGQSGAGTSASDAVRFGSVDVFIDSGPAALAAYQFELDVTAGNVTLVGVEGGEHRAFQQAPYYDPRAHARGAAHGAGPWGRRPGV